MRGDPALDFINMCEGAVPSYLQLRCDQTVRRVGGVILPEDPIGGVPGGLQIAAEGVPDLVATTNCLRLRFGGGRNCARLDDTQQRFLNRIVDAQFAEGDATRLAIIEQTPPTGIARDVVLRARVSQCELSTAAPTVLQCLALRPDRFAVFGYAHVPQFKKLQRKIDKATLADCTGRLAQAEAIAALLMEAGNKRIGFGPKSSNASCATFALMWTKYAGSTPCDPTSCCTRISGCAIRSPGGSWRLTDPSFSSLKRLPFWCAASHRPSTLISSRQTSPIVAPCVRQPNVATPDVAYRPASRPQHFLNFRPLPQGHGSFLPD